MISSNGALDFSLIDKPGYYCNANSSITLHYPFRPLFAQTYHILTHLLSDLYRHYEIVIISILPPYHSTYLSIRVSHPPLPILISSPPILYKETISVRDGGKNGFDEIRQADIRI